MSPKTNIDECIRCHRVVFHSYTLPHTTKKIMEHNTPENISEEPQSEKIKQSDELSMSQVIEESQYFNTLLIMTMDRITQIVEDDKITPDDISWFRQMESSFCEITLDFSKMEQFGDELRKLIMKATMTEAYNRGIQFFGNPVVSYWNQRLEEYKVRFICLTDDSSFMLEFLDSFHAELVCLCRDYQSIVLKQAFIPLVDFLNFNEVFDKAEEEQDLRLRKQIYVNAIVESNLVDLTIEMDEGERRMHHAFLQKCNKAIEVVDFQIRHAQPDQRVSEDITSDRTENSKDFTTRRQVLSMYYLLNELDKSTHQIDRTVKARFIEFLTGKNYDSIYKSLSNPHKGLDSNNPQNAQKDMEYVKSHFEKLGLQNIVDKITNDMKPA